MNKEEQKKLLEELEQRKADIIKMREDATTSYEKTINTGALLGINDAIRIIKKEK